MQLLSCYAIFFLEFAELCVPYLSSALFCALAAFPVAVAVVIGDLHWRAAGRSKLEVRACKRDEAERVVARLAILFRAVYCSWAALELCHPATLPAIVAVVLVSAIVMFVKQVAEPVTAKSASFFSMFDFPALFLLVVAFVALCKPEAVQEASVAVIAALAGHQTATIMTFLVGPQTTATTTAQCDFAACVFFVLKVLGLQGKAETVVGMFFGVAAFRLAAEGFRVAAEKDESNARWDAMLLDSLQKVYAELDEKDARLQANVEILNKFLAEIDTVGGVVAWTHEQVAELRNHLAVTDGKHLDLENRDEMFEAEHLNEALWVNKIFDNTILRDDDTEGVLDRVSRNVVGILGWAIHGIAKFLAGLYASAVAVVPTIKPFLAWAVDLLARAHVMVGLAVFWGCAYFIRIIYEAWTSLEVFLAVAKRRVANFSQAASPAAFDSVERLLAYAQGAKARGAVHVCVVAVGFPFWWPAFLCFFALSVCVDAFESRAADTARADIDSN